MSVTIPPSVKNLKIKYLERTEKNGEFISSVFNNSQKREIVFLDYKNSAFLNSTDNNDIKKVNDFFNGLPNGINIILKSPNQKDRAIRIGSSKDERITDNIIIRRRNDKTQSNNETNYNIDLQYYE